MSKSFNEGSKNIDWSKQHCGLHKASASAVALHMPDVFDLLMRTFPERLEDFTWDVKVHMLMPAQWPCIPNWHFDNVPRVNNAQDFSRVRPELPMYLWISGEPLTEFMLPDGRIEPVKPKTWHKFTQLDRHRGTQSHAFQWRGFIRATHRDLSTPIDNCVRLHSQVYLDAESFRW